MNANPETSPAVTVVGDVLPAGKVAQSLRRIGFANAAARVRSLLRSRLAIGNLECPLCSRAPASPFKADGGPNLRGDPSVAHWLREAGFQVLALANNHTMDCGPEGLCETLDCLHKAGLQTVGAGRNANEAVRPLVLEAPSGQIALLSFGNGTPATRRNPGVAPFQSDALLAGLAQVPKAVVATIVFVHAGIEFLQYPESWTRGFAEEALRARADLVVGGHPHCLRGIQQGDKGLVVFSVGDFMADTSDPELLRDHLQRTALTRLGFPIADGDICRQGLAVDVHVSQPHVLNCTFRPVMVDGDFLPREPNEAEMAVLRERLRTLSVAIDDTNSEGMRKAREIELAYRSVYGNGRSWGSWLALPLRVGLKYASRLWRRTVGPGEAR